MSSEPSLPCAPSVADEGHEATTIVGGVRNNGSGTTTCPTEGTATPLWDLPVDKLETCLHDLAEPADFDEFWAERLTEACAHDVIVTVEPVETGLVWVETYDVTFRGYDGEHIKAWYQRLAGIEDPAPRDMFDTVPDMRSGTSVPPGSRIRRRRWWATSATVAAAPCPWTI